MREAGRVPGRFEAAASREELDEIAAEVMLRALREKPDALFCLATGSSPEGAYALFVRRAIGEHLPVHRLRIVKLDEWCGLSKTDPATCESFLRRRVIEPLGIAEDHYLAFDGEAADPEAECLRIGARLSEAGPIDLCVLGLGRNGHLGLNEPGEFLEAGPHVARLEERTMLHSMLAGHRGAGSGVETLPDRGMTLGMRDIMQSRIVLFLASGPEKEEAWEGFRSGRISTKHPSSLLHLHPGLLCIHERRFEAPEPR